MVLEHYHARRTETLTFNFEIARTVPASGDYRVMRGTEMYDGEFKVRGPVPWPAEFPNLKKNPMRRRLPANGTLVRGGEWDRARAGGKGDRRRPADAALPSADSALDFLPWPAGDLPWPADDQMPLAAELNWFSRTKP
jgi:hypothetical protein